MPHREHGPNAELSGWIQRQFPPGYLGYAVDVGASDGVSVSTTFALEMARWTVLCIEPNPAFWYRLKQLRAFVQTCACDSKPADDAIFHVHDDNPEAYSSLRPNHPENKPGTGWSTIKVRVKTLEQCLEEAKFPKLDVIAVDVEGLERDVLEGVDLKKWKPKVVVLESWEPGSLDEYLGGFGYRNAGRSIHNDLYVLNG